MAYDPDRLKELTADIVGGIKKRRSDSRAEMEASRVVPEKLPVAPEDEGRPAVWMEWDRWLVICGVSDRSRLRRQRRNGRRWEEGG